MSQVNHAHESKGHLEVNAAFGGIVVYFWCMILLALQFNLAVILIMHDALQISFT